MSKKLLALVAASLALVSLPSHAGNGYVGISAGNFSYDDANATLNTLGVTGRFGYRLAKFLDIELRAAVGNAQDNGSREFQLNYLGGAFLKLNIQPVSDSHFELYLIGGGSYIEARIGSVGATVVDTDSTASYGLGIDLFGSRNAALNIEWIRYGDGRLKDTNTEYTLDVLQIGYVRHF